MRSFDHWNIRYLQSRFSDILYRKFHPEHPWLTSKAISMLQNELLNCTDIGLEFGSGRSTLWFSRRINQLTSVEHDPIWYKKTKDQLIGQGINNVDYTLASGTEDESGYLKVVDTFPDSSLDYILVDGIFRDACILKTIPKLKPGGFLIIDNVNKYLPSDSNSPNSRSFTQGPKNESWQILADLLKTWRVEWTSNGVFDTAFYFKPFPKS
jgi:SAM-dependent methyltransferase